MSNHSRRAIYPGTFDPLTNGHLDIIERSSKIFDEIVVAIGDNPDKNPLFTVVERTSMIKKATQHLPNITLVKFNSLLIDLASQLNANIIIRGIRTATDFEYESQMGYANKRLRKDLETIYLMPSLEYSYISSSVVRAILKFDGSIEPLVPKSILEEVEAKRKGLN
ncbi:MAG: Phosphopantetheine adenylyltransferase (EC [uncultured Sulfurovum sp.]|uniref:Phosphopantetheine adenylyltransferase n=1 Tax=uncultured Sulfurovum sp. TaxID=269237 RepID=A0A6S6TFD8_9BACT|nr:MAG: Phosphopantetheine adenylyltransferase (EC [uncultured Sulfurovum sp.]